MTSRASRIGVWLALAVAGSVLVAALALLRRTGAAPAGLTAIAQPDFLDHPHRHRALAPGAPKP